MCSALPNFLAWVTSLGFGIRISRDDSSGDAGAFVGGGCRDRRKIHVDMIRFSLGDTVNSSADDLRCRSISTRKKRVTSLYMLAMNVKRWCDRTMLLSMK